MVPLSRRAAGDEGLACTADRCGGERATAFNPEPVLGPKY